MGSLGNKIKYLREKQNITQKEFAQKIGVSNVVLSRYETDERKPDYDTLQRIAEYFEVSIDYLLGRTNNSASTSKAIELLDKDEKDIAKRLEAIMNELDSNSALAFDGEPMNEVTRELVKAQIESNLRTAKEMAKKKFTPKKYRNDYSEE